MEEKKMKEEKKKKKPTRKEEKILEERKWLAFVWLNNATAVFMAGNKTSVHRL